MQILVVSVLTGSVAKTRKSIACMQSRRVLERDPWIVFRNDIVPPSWTLVLPESWDESKSDFKGEVDGFEIGEGEGRGGKYPPLHRPSPLLFFVAFQDGGHDQCTSELSLKKEINWKINWSGKVLSGGRGGGVLNNVLYGEAPPWGLTPYPFINHFWQKRIPLLYTLYWQMVPLSHTQYKILHPL